MVQRLFDVRSAIFIAQSSNFRLKALKYCSASIHHDGKRVQSAGVVRPVRLKLCYQCERRKRRRKKRRKKGRRRSNRFNPCSSCASFAPDAELSRCSSSDNISSNNSYSSSSSSGSISNNGPRLLLCNSANKNKSINSNNSISNNGPSLLLCNSGNSNNSINSNNSNNSKTRRKGSNRMSGGPLQFPLSFSIGLSRCFTMAERVVRLLNFFYFAKFLYYPILYIFYFAVHLLTFLGQ